MNDYLVPERFDVPTTGGTLRVGQWGDSGPAVLALHGITASHMTWPFVARELSTDARFIAPDLRGRGGSRDLPGPYGMKVHADDCVAILDHLGIDKAVVAGHSMGGFVAAILALHHPERVAALVLLDGGVPLAVPPPDVVDPDQLLTAMLGPAMQRLTMTFASLDDYYDFWRVHPSVQEEGAWNELFESYLAYDLMGEEPELHSKTNPDAVMGDGRDTLENKDLRVALEKIQVPITFIRAPRGILNETPGLYADEVVADLRRTLPSLDDHLIDDVNHYTLTTSERGALATSAVIRKAIERVSA
ncbi:MAG: alpha/beta hydrolase [Actinomycetota bacterium]